MDTKSTKTGRPIFAVRHGGHARSLFIPVLVVSLLAVVAAVALVVVPTLIEEMREPPPQETTIRRPCLGERPARIALEPLTGDAKPVSLENLAGKIAVINFWGTWCPPCRMEFPELVDLQKQLRQYPDFRLCLVSCDSGSHEEFEELKDQTKAFLADSHYEIPTYWDPGFKTRAAFHRAAVLRGYPSTFVLDREGVIQGVWPGYRPGCGEEIRQLVLKLIRTPAQESPSRKARAAQSGSGAAAIAAPTATR